MGQSTTPLTVQEHLLVDPGTDPPVLRCSLDATARLPDLGPARPSVTLGWLPDSPEDFPLDSPHQATVRLLEQELRRRGATTELTAKNTLIAQLDGHVRIYHHSSSETSPRGSTRATDLKHITRRLLVQSGRPAGGCVAEGRHFEDPSQLHEAEQLMAGLGTVVVKPADGTKGTGVSVHVQDATSLHRAWREAFAHAGTAGVLVEKHVTGVEARFTVVGGRTVAVALRQPPQVVGDGTSTLQELITAVNRRRRHNPHLASRPIILDPHRIARLHAHGLTTASVLPPGEVYIIDHKAGYSTGAESVEVTGDVHPSYLEAAARAVDVVPGLSVAGVDLIAEDFAAPAAPGNHTVIEVNAQPGIAFHHFPSIGEPRDVAAEIITLHSRPGHQHPVTLDAPRGTRPRRNSPASAPLCGLACWRPRVASSNR